MPPFYRDTTFFLIPYYGNNDNPCYNENLRKERELSLLPSSTVDVIILFAKRKKNPKIKFSLKLKRNHSKYDWISLIYQP